MYTDFSFLENKGMSLHFPSFLNIGMVQELELLPHGTQGPFLKSALLVYHGYVFFAYNSRNTPHNSAVWVKYGASFMIGNLIKVLLL